MSTLNIQTNNGKKEITLYSNKGEALTSDKGDGHALTVKASNGTLYASTTNSRFNNTVAAVVDSNGNLRYINQSKPTMDSKRAWPTYTSSFDWKSISLPYGGYIKVYSTNGNGGTYGSHSDGNGGIGGASGYGWRVYVGTSTNSYKDIGVPSGAGGGGGGGSTTSEGYYAQGGAGGVGGLATISLGPGTWYIKTVQGQNGGNGGAIVNASGGQYEGKPDGGNGGAGGDSWPAPYVSWGFSDDSGDVCKGQAGANGHTRTYRTIEAPYNPAHDYTLSGGAGGPSGNGWNSSALQYTLNLNTSFSVGSQSVSTSFTAANSSSASFEIYEYYYK